MFFSVPREWAGFLVEDADPFVGPLLIPALLADEDLVFDQPVSRRLPEGAERVRSIFCQWTDRARPIDISLPVKQEHAPPADGRGVGCLASGGIDSWYTILKERERITHLVHIHGASEPLEDPRFSHALSANEARVRRTEETVGVPVIVGKTDMRDRFPLDWGLFYNGSGLAGFALALGGGFHTLLIPSSYRYADLHPWGSHPLVDEAYSTDRVRIVHHGCEASRAEKTEWLLLHHPEILRDVQVCVKQETAGTRNCGRCQKCVRTMVALELLGALDAAAFPDRLPEDTEALVMFDSLQFVGENLALGRRVAPESRLTSLLSRCVARMRRLNSLRTWAENTPVVRDVVELRRRHIERRAAAVR